MDPGGRRSRPVRPEAVDLGRRQRIVGRGPGNRARAVAGAPLAPPNALGARQHEDLLDGGARRPGYPREPERILHDQARRREHAQPATRKARDDVHAGAGAAGQRQCAAERDRLADQRVIELCAGQPEHAATDVDRRLERLVLDDPVGVQSPREGRSRALSNTQIGTSRPISTNATPGTNSGEESNVNATAVSRPPPSATAAARLIYGTPSSSHHSPTGTC